MSGSRRPVVGVSAAVHPARFTVWADVDVNLSPRTYSTAIGAAGGLPVLLPPDEATADEPDALLELLDGLILAGGADVDPSLYGADAAAETQVANRERDGFEIALASGALERELPILGVCRGMEVMNVACGGTLEQHLPESQRHLHTPGRFIDHDVRFEPGSLAARAAGAERIGVRSHHHQGIGRLGDGLVASGWSEPDGVIEALERPGPGFALGVLWHPEEDARDTVVASLVAASLAEVPA